MDYKVRPSAVLESFFRTTNVKHSFTGSAGQAIISKTAAYLITDSRYWLQAEQELDENWILIRVGMPSGPRNWVDWISVSAFFSTLRTFVIKPPWFGFPHRTVYMSRESVLMRVWSPMRPLHSSTPYSKQRSPSLFIRHKTWST
jgi:Creatinase/Prolidase N-terminal domain